MNLEGSYTFDAPRQVVWDSLMTPEVLAKVLPGCEKLEQVGDDQYEAVLKIRVGPVQGKFKGNVKIADLVEPESYSMTVDGKGAPGFLTGTGQVKMEEQGESTVLHYTGEAQVGGRIAQVGQRLLDSSAKALTRQSLDGLNKQVLARAQGDTSPDGAGAAAADVAPVEAPSEMEFAMGMAKSMLEDMAPPERRPLLIAAGAGVLFFFVFLTWWGKMIARRAAREARRRY